MDEKKPERESELRGGLNNLESVTNNLRTQVKELAGKLTPVMREIQATPTAESQPENQYSPTGQQIRAITYTVNETADRVQEIMQHLEV